MKIKLIEHPEVVTYKEEVCEYDDNAKPFISFFIDGNDGIIFGDRGGVHREIVDYDGVLDKYTTGKYPMVAEGSGGIYELLDDHADSFCLGRAFKMNDTGMVIISMWNKDEYWNNNALTS